MHVTITRKCNRQRDFYFSGINAAARLIAKKRKFSHISKAIRDNCIGCLLGSDAWFPPLRCRSSVAVSPFCLCKIPLFCKNYVRKFRSVAAVNSKKICNGSGNGNGDSVRKRQRLTGTEKRQRKNGNGMMETRHKLSTNSVCLPTSAK